MAKPIKNITRTVASDGSVRYFYGGRRVDAKKGRAKYLRSQYTKLVSQAEGAKPLPFTPKLRDQELRSLKQMKAQRSLDRFRGRPVPKLVSYFFKEVMKSIPPGQGVDFSKLIGPDGKPVYKRYSDLLREVDRATDALAYKIETSQGLPGFRGRDNLSSIIDIVEMFSDPAFSNARLRVRLPGYMGSGDITGRNTVFEAIREWEYAVIASVMEARQNVAYVKFDYHPNYDFKDGIVTFDLRLKPGEIADHARDFADLKHEGVIIHIMQSDPIKRTN